MPRPSAVARSGRDPCGPFSEHLMSSRHTIARDHDSIGRHAPPLPDRAGSSVATRSTRRRIGRELAWSGTAVAVGVVVVAATWAFARAGGQSFGELSRDPNAISESPPSNGALSLLGIGLWGLAVGAAVLAATVLHRTGRPGRLAWAAWAGVSALLLVDDALQAHEALLPHRGIPESVVFVVYGVIAFAAAIVLANELRSFETGLGLVAAVAVLGLSLAVDVLFDTGTDSSDVLIAEDGLKFVGIGLWALGTIRAAGTVCVTGPPEH